MSDMEHISTPVDRILQNLRAKMDERAANAQALAQITAQPTRTRQDFFDFETEAMEAQKIAGTMAAWERLQAQGIVK